MPEPEGPEPGRKMEKMDISTATQPHWYERIPAERRGLWTSDDGERALQARTLAGFPVRLVLKDGTILDGDMGEDRHRAGGEYDIAVKLAGRKTQKWVSEDDIAVIWSDTGPDLRGILNELVQKLRTA